MDIDTIIRQSLRDFADEIAHNYWRGKEREAISLYAFGHLIEYCHPNSILFDPRQIAIEVRVPKPKQRGKKKEVCKDLVIWRAPGMTCWDASGASENYPLAVLEWKVNSPKTHRQDVEWLRAFSADNAQVIGYAISIELREQELCLNCARVKTKSVKENWLTCKIKWIKGESKMTRKEKFVALVQTAAIVESLSRGKSAQHHPKPSSIAAIAVNVAIDVQEESLPVDLTAACEELVAYVYDNTIPKPKWLIGIL